jgi:hypothetical protein
MDSFAVETEMNLEVTDLVPEADSFYSELGSLLISYFVPRPTFLLSLLSTNK